ncbi:hypothetical protein QQ020_09555 [Fulvivirgaceae bacterium BMA12]|uniref:Uncharacterized protein n=1 Tax=Agaribacillus aureus TaxID=3051825 RepID=A0ABT8L3J3_9BACT|nr:hypothetical protein [Fulvivirgaceae bacterium BMA12]
MAQNDEGFMYGKVTTVSGNVYLGQLRWGDEEIFWNDIFNSSKVSNNNFKYIHEEEEQDDEKENSWLDFDWKFLSIWDDKFSSTSHRFACRFGDIKSIIIRGDEKVDVLLKNGAKINVRGGSNDIGTKIKIYDAEIGRLELRWSKIRQIDFMPTPTSLNYKFGHPLFGTVETYRKGDFVGYVQWDHDERISSDILDGKSQDGGLKIPFGNIKILESKNSGSIVILNSGREIYLTGSNDVNKENRGIIVTSDQLGKIDIPWREFKKVTFEKTMQSGASYQSYPTPRAIKGKVKIIGGESLQGLIVYDLDESWDFELLDGNDDNLKYRIPFRNIKKIIPKNYNYSLVTLRNGLELLLGDERDVSEENDGLLIFKRNHEKPTYIKWKTVDEIIFD